MLELKVANINIRAFKKIIHILTLKNLFLDYKKLNRDAKLDIIITFIYN